MKQRFVAMSCLAVLVACGGSKADPPDADPGTPDGGGPGTPDGGTPDGSVAMGDGVDLRLGEIPR